MWLSPQFKLEKISKSNLMTISRKNFIRSGLLAATGLAAPALFSMDLPGQDKPAPLSPDSVREFVRVCHFDLAKVHEMLTAEPRLLHSSWDLGGGDFESGIEAAGHVGNREIADYLLSKGARYNVFLAAMYGHLEVVKTALAMQPLLLHALGPHGLTLLHHARKGGDQAKQVEILLMSLGATETKIKFFN